MSFPNTPLPESNLQSFLQRFVDATKRLQPGNGDTLSILNSPNGLNVEVSDAVLSDKPGNVYAEYIEGNQYHLGDKVFIKTGKTYQSGSTYFYSLPANYECISPVPPKIDLSYIADKATRTHYASISQVDDIIYAPIFPYVSETPAHDTVDGRGCYWHLVSLATIQMTVCVNGVNKKYLIDAAESGSITTLISDINSGFAPKDNPTFTGTTIIETLKMDLDGTAKALIVDGASEIAASTVTETELSYLGGATSNIQEQLDAIGYSGSVLPTTASYAINADTALTSLTASFSTTSQTASYYRQRSGSGYFVLYADLSTGQLVTDYEPD